MDIAYKAVDYFRGKQLLSIDEVEVFNRLKNYEDNIQSVSVSFSLPNTLKIEIGSFKEMFNVVINEKNYILVENGTLVPANPNKNLKFLNLKKDFDKNSFIEYKQVFQPRYIEKINNIVKRFEQNFINVPIEALHYYEVERELHLEISGNRLLIFSLDTNTSIESQIEKLAIFNKDYFTI
jgi:hypothetical protein